MISSTPSHDELGNRKQEIRAAGHAARNAQVDKAGVSRLITETVLGLPEYQAANCVMWYVDTGAETSTRHALPAAIASDKKVVVPFCVDGELELFQLESMDELSEGMYGILEPREELRELAAKRVLPEQLDLILIPGVAFDRRGGRAGHGKGYYDKLLQNARPDTPLISLAFECQMFDEIPMQDHDIFMDKVVTQSDVYTGQGRRSS